jgi:hypothetical protein
MVRVPISFPICHEAHLGVLVVPNQWFMNVVLGPGNPTLDAQHGGRPLITRLVLGRQMSLLDSGKNHQDTNHQDMNHLDMNHLDMSHALTQVMIGLSLVGRAQSIVMNRLVCLWTVRPLSHILQMVLRAGNQLGGRIVGTTHPQDTTGTACRRLDIVILHLWLRTLATSRFLVGLESMKIVVGGLHAKAVDIRPIPHHAHRRPLILVIVIVFRFHLATRRRHRHCQLTHEWTTSLGANGPIVMTRVA